MHGASRPIPLAPTRPTTRAPPLACRRYSAKLLKKPDQCRAVCRASYMFWSPVGEAPYRNGKRVLECLQRSLKIADACKASNAHVGLFVEVLDAYLYQFEQENEHVTAGFINSLAQLIERELDANPDTDAKVKAHYGNAKAAIKSKKERNERFQEIEIG